MKDLPVMVWLSLMVLLLAAAQPALATDFFVSPGGNNAGTGLIGDPWLTLQNAADTVTAGDTVTVLPGNYTGFELTTSGTALNPIVFQAQPGTVIDAPNAGTTQDGINLELASFVVIDGFEITAMPRAGIRAVGASDDHSQFVTIRNNIADLNGRWGIFTGYAEDLLIENNQTSRSADEHGIYVSNSADRPTIRGNISWGNNASGIQINADGTLPGDGVITQALVSRNTIYDNGVGGGASINLDGVQDSRIENNLIYDAHATGIALFQIDGSDGSKNNQVINNTVVVESDGRWGITVTGGSTGNTILNNTFYSEHGFRGAMDISVDSLTDLLSDFNAIEDRVTTDGGNTTATLAQWQAQTGQDANSFVATPAQLYTNPATDDYTLGPLSPAIDAGTLSLAPAIDLFATPRPIGLGVDIGAIELPEPSGLVSLGVIAAGLALRPRRNSRNL